MSVKDIFLPNKQKNSETTIFQSKEKFFRSLKRALLKKINCDSITCDTIAKIELHVHDTFDKTAPKYYKGIKD